MGFFAQLDCHEVLFGVDSTSYSCFSIYSSQLSILIFMHSCFINFYFFSFKHFLGLKTDFRNHFIFMYQINFNTFRDFIWKKI